MPTLSVIVTEETAGRLAKYIEVLKQRNRQLGGGLTKEQRIEAGKIAATVSWEASQAYKAGCLKKQKADITGVCDQFIREGLERFELEQEAKEPVIVTNAAGEVRIKAPPKSKRK